MNPEEMSENERDSLVARYVDLHTQKVIAAREMEDIGRRLGWTGSAALFQAAAGGEQQIHQADLFGFVKVMLGLMDVKYQYMLFRDPIANGGGGSVVAPERPERPERPDRDRERHSQLIERDRRNRDIAREQIDRSNLSTADKVRAKEEVEKGHRECIGNAAKCIP